MKKKIFHSLVKHMVTRSILLIIILVWNNAA